MEVKALKGLVRSQMGSGRMGGLCEVISDPWSFSFHPFIFDGQIVRRGEAYTVRVRGASISPETRNSTVTEQSRACVGGGSPL